MAEDVPRCIRLLNRISRAKKRDQSTLKLEKSLKQLVAASKKRVIQRTADVPQPVYNDALPITAHREEIVEAIRNHQVVVIAGETGSGKTTQIPKFSLEAGRGTTGLIGCTQPRRIAASAMAERVAAELNCKLGETVGYQVRFRRKLTARTLIKFMTDGILLADSAADRFLNAYDTIILDEAHERSLNIDFLLGYIKQLLPRRPDLRVVVTSATIDTEKFSRHFSDAPVIEVSGRGYPVELLYLPLEEQSGADNRSDKTLYQAIAAAIRRLDGVDPRGDVLVFLAGEREIREAAEYLTRQGLKHSEVLPLYARLDHAG